MAQRTETREQQIQGEFTTAEVTHVLETLAIEGGAYLENHVLMKLSGVEGPIREVHDQVTRKNLDRLQSCAKTIGVPLPFAQPLEDRENEIKDRLQGANVEGVYTEGEVLHHLLVRAKNMAQFYNVSLNLATNREVRDTFRQNMIACIEAEPKLMEAFRNTKEFVMPPTARSVVLPGVLAKGAQPRRG